MKDDRIVYGALCSYVGDIKTVSKGDHGLPGCPHCKGVLFEMTTKQHWNAIDEFEAGSRDGVRHPGYRKMMEWAMNRTPCFAGFNQMAEAYTKETGIVVPLGGWKTQ